MGWRIKKSLSLVSVVTYNGPSSALHLLLPNEMRHLILPTLLAGCLGVACQTTNQTLPGHSTSSSKPTRTSLTGRDLVLMADERQALHYRILAAERLSAASRLAEAGEVDATDDMLHGAVVYQRLAEEAAARVADRVARANAD